MGEARYDPENEVERETFGIALQAHQGLRHGSEKFIAQSSAMLLIPIVCLLKVRPGG